MKILARTTHENVQIGMPFTTDQVNTLVTVVSRFQRFGQLLNLLQVSLLIAVLYLFFGIIEEMVPTIKESQADIVIKYVFWLLFFLLTFMLVILSSNASGKTPIVCCCTTFSTLELPEECSLIIQRLLITSRKIRSFIMGVFLSIIALIVAEVIFFIFFLVYIRDLPRPFVIYGWSFVVFWSILISTLEYHARIGISSHHRIQTNQTSIVLIFPISSRFKILSSPFLSIYVSLTDSFVSWFYLPVLFFFSAPTSLHSLLLRLSFSTPFVLSLCLVLCSFSQTLLFFVKPLKTFPARLDIFYLF